MSADVDVYSRTRVLVNEAIEKLRGDIDVRSAILRDMAEQQRLDKRALTGLVGVVKDLKNGG